MGNTAGDQFADGGSIPAPALHFRTGRKAEANAMVMEYHYSHRLPTNVQMVGSLHLDGGLFGGDGQMVCAAFWRMPPTKWSEPVIELTRLVRANNKVPLTLLISLCCKQLKKMDHDLLISYADKTYGHDGYVYKAANWNYAGLRKPKRDGVMIDGIFKPSRSCNSVYGTNSPTKLKAILLHKTIIPHYDKGKHLYWKALGRRGIEKAKRLGLY